MAINMIADQRWSPKVPPAELEFPVFLSWGKSNLVHQYFSPDMEKNSKLAKNRPWTNEVTFKSHR